MNKAIVAFGSSTMADRKCSSSLKRCRPLDRFPVESSKRIYELIELVENFCTLRNVVHGAVLSF